MIILFGALCRENEEKQCFSCDIIDFFDDLWEQPKIYKKPNQKGKTLFLTWYHSLFIRNCVNINERNVWYHSLFIKIFVNIKNHKKRKSLTKASFLIKSFVKRSKVHECTTKEKFFSHLISLFMMGSSMCWSQKKLSNGGKPLFFANNSCPFEHTWDRLSRAHRRGW